MPRSHTGGVGVQLYAFLTLELDGAEWSASQHACFTLSTHWIGGWVVLIAGLDAVEKKKVPATAGD